MRISENEKFYFWHKTRFFVLFLSLVCMTLAQVNSITFNFTVICMEELIGQAHERNETHWMADPTKKSFVFSGSAIGALIGLFPSVYLIDRFGVRKTLTLCGLLSSLSSLLFPLSVSLSYPTVILIRLLEGIAASLLITVIAMIATIWAPLSEMGTFFAILSCVFQLSMIISMPISGLLCESRMGWRSVYYFFGAATFLGYVGFWLVYRDNPMKHPNVSKKEALRIQKDKMMSYQDETNNKRSAPWKEICSDPTVLVSWIAIIGADINFLLLIIYGPTYLRKVLHFDVINTGISAALPYISSIIIKILCGRLSDTMNCISVKARFCIFAGISHGFQALGLLVMSQTTDKTVAQIAFTVAITACGVNTLGNGRCIQLRCRQYVHFSMAIVTFIGASISFLTPVIVGIMCPNNTPEEWSRLFIIASIIVVLFYIPFPIFTSDQPGPYVYAEESGKNFDLPIIKL